MSSGFRIFDDSPAALPRVGDTISHFEILEELGEGGMAVVYRARDTELGREVALKFPFFETDLVPPEEVQNLRERFIREAQVLARISHPGIVQIYEAVLRHGNPFFVMEYVDGATLHDRMQQQPTLTFAEITRTALEVTRALRFAWDHFKIVHRDLKPANVMIAGNSAVKVLDMGLAKVMDDEESSQFITRTGFTAGTPEYMAPEQHTGVKDLDQRADIFSLGVILCELYTRRNPFPQDNFIKALQAKIDGVPFQLEEQAAGLPEELTRLVYAMLACERDQRIASYSEIEAVLDKALSALEERTQQARARRDRQTPGGVAAGLRHGTVQLARNEKTRPMSQADLSEAVDLAVASGIYTGDADNNPPEVADHPEPAGPSWAFARGTMAGRYELQELLGRGSFGAVYRAADTDNGDQVAVKFLDMPRDGNALERFQTLGQKLVSLEDETICRVRDYGVIRFSYFYLVSDLVRFPGGATCNLHHYRTRYGGEDGHVAESHVRKVGLLLLSALSAAHARDILHGNLKPTNILFDCVGTHDGGYLRLHMKLTDFGLIALVGREHIRQRLQAMDPDSTEATATLSETMLYLSPEQWDGADPSIEGDLYSVGMLIHYFLTGRPAMNPDQQPPSSFRRGIHEGWDPLLGKVLRREPDRRFHSALEFAEYLAAIKVPTE